MNPNNLDDPSATYRGYRRQALYNLHRILVRDSLNDNLYRPEGKEDLEIRDAGDSLLEVVQIKDLSEPLTLSDLEPGNEKKFFGRLASYIQENPKVKIVLACFGEFGPELRDAINGSKLKRSQVVKKIAGKNTNISEATANLYLDSMTMERPEEETLERELLAHLKTSGPTGCEPTTVLALLFHWIYRASENTERLTRSKISEQLQKIGSFVSERSAFYDEWQQSLHPLPSARELTNDERQAYKEQYYAGQSARYDHILADLDVKRTHLLEQLDNLFKQERVVIVHGASGQGKTTLALRYLREYFNDQQVFFLKNIADRNRAERLPRALSGLLKRNVSLVLYMDVHPGDRYWWHFLENLRPSSFPSLHILVTIREEDFRRTERNENIFGFKRLEMILDKEEASYIYDRLPQKGADFLDFETVWREFGGSGPLMELIYLVTQGQSLKAQLKDQISRLESELTDDELNFIRIFAIATAYEAKLDLSSLIKNLSLSPSTFKKTLNQLEKEYLIRESGGVLFPVHPLRSKIISTLLCDEDLLPWHVDALACLKVMDELDLDFFLHMAFLEKPESTEALRTALGTFEPKTWSGRAGVSRALVWLGIRDHIERNRPLLDRATQYMSIRAGYFLDWDLMNLMEESCGSRKDMWLALPQKGIAPVDELHAKQTPKKEVFVYLRTWLESATQRPSPPTLDVDWPAAAAVAGWVGFLKIQDPWRSWLDSSFCEAFLNQDDFLSLAELIAAMSLDQNELFEVWYETNLDQIETGFLAETGALWLEDGDDCIRAHFPLSLHDIFASLDLEQPHPEIFHDRALKVLGLMRRCFPNKDAYGCQGYGHRLVIQTGTDREAISLTPHDDTDKNRVLRHRLPLDWCAKTNALGIEYAGKAYRPKDWSAYAGSMLEIRVESVAFLEKLQKFLDRYCSRKKPIQFPNDLEQERERVRAKVNLPPQLPNTTFDPWGYVTDDGNLSNKAEFKGVALSEKQQTKALGLTAVLDLQDAVKQFMSPLANFLTQFPGAYLFNTLDRDPRGKEQKEAHLSQVGYRRECVFLSLENLMTACRNCYRMQSLFETLMQRFFDESESTTLQRRENNTLTNLLAIWVRLTTHPRLEMVGVTKKTVRQISYYRERLLDNLARALETLEGSPTVAKTICNAESKRWVILTLDFQNAYDCVFSMENSSIIVAKVLMEELKDASFVSATAFWNYLAMIPLWKGKMPENRGIISEFGKDSNAQLLQAKFFLFPRLPKTVLEQMNIQQWSHPLMLAPKGFLEQALRLLLTYDYIEDLSELLSNDHIDRTRKNALFENVLDSLNGVEAGVRFFIQGIGNSGYNTDLQKEIQADIEILIKWMKPKESDPLPKMDWLKLVKRIYANSLDHVAEAYHIFRKSKGTSSIGTLD